MSLLGGIGKVIGGGAQIVKSAIEAPIDAAVTTGKLAWNAVSTPLEVAKDTVVGAGKTGLGALTLNGDMMKDGLHQATVGNVKNVVDHVAINPVKIAADGLNDQWENLTGKRVGGSGPVVLTSYGYGPPPGYQP